MERDAGVRHGDVDAAPGLGGTRHEAAGHDRVRDVALGGEDFPAVRADPPRGLRGQPAVEVVQQDARPLAREPPRNLEADALPRSGDDGHTPREAAAHAEATRPRSSATTRLPMRWIMSRSWVATTTVVPRAFTSRNRRMIS